MTEREVREFQDWMNKFSDKYLSKVKRIAEDGDLGRETKVRAESCKYFLGFGKSRHAPDGELTDYFLRCLKSPKGKFIPRRTRLAGAKRRAAQRRRAKRSSTSWNGLWGGSRTVTNEVISIVRDVNSGIPITSRKRSWGSWGSDHNVAQARADAVDFGTANNHWLKNKISRSLGGPVQLRDYGSFHITRNGKRFRVQIIAGTHGTGPHLHVGVRRA